MKDLLHIGIDIGSTTVKIAVLNNVKQCLHACYVTIQTFDKKCLTCWKTPMKFSEIGKFLLP